MLPERLWKLDALMRLLLSVFVCFFAGSFLLAAIQYSLRGPTVGTKVYALVAASMVCLGATLWLLNAPWREANGLKRAAVLMGLFYLGLILGGWGAKVAGPFGPSVTQMIVSALSLQGAAFVLIGCFLREHETTWTLAFGLRVRWPVALLAGICLACAFTPLAWILQSWSATLMTWLHLTPQLQEAVQTLQTDRDTSGRLLFGAITVLIVPAAEEAFFRGILYTWVKTLGFPRLALWGTSILFSTVHGNLPGFVPLTLFAVALVILYERCGNLLAPISAHAAFNVANLVQFYLLEPR
jgi:membrane protease YdiL (CAAX protease family)